MKKQGYKFPDTVPLNYKVMEERKHVDLSILLFALLNSFPTVHTYEAYRFFFDNSARMNILTFGAVRPVGPVALALGQGPHTRLAPVKLTLLLPNKDNRLAHETGPSQTDPFPIPNKDDRSAEVGWTDLNRGRHHRYTKQCWSSDELNKLSLRQYFFEALKRISHNKTNRQCHLKASKQSRNHVLVVYEQDVFITTDKTKTTTYSIKYVYVCIM